MFRLSKADFLHAQKAFRDLDPIVVLDALPKKLYANLKQEALSSLHEGWLCCHDGSGTPPAQRCKRGELKKFAREWSASSGLCEQLKKITGCWAKVSWDASCYTAYLDVGHYLSPHRDRSESCAMTLLIYFSSADDTKDPGTSLDCWPLTTDQKLSIPSMENTLVLLAGDRVLHGRQKLQSSQKIYLLSLCFSLSRNKNDTH